MSLDFKDTYLFPDTFSLYSLLSKTLLRTAVRSYKFSLREMLLKTMQLGGRNRIPAQAARLPGLLS